MASGIYSVEYSFDYNGSNADSITWHTLSLDNQNPGNEAEGLYYYASSAQAPNKSSGSNANGYGYDIYPTAIGRGYVPVAIRVTDKAGNATIVWAEDDHPQADNLKLAVTEKTKPSDPSTDITKIVDDQRPTLAWTITDKSAGASGIRYGQISIDGGAWITVNAPMPTANGQSGQYTFEYTPTENLSEATHTYKVRGADYDGNLSNESREYTFIVDVSVPVVSGIRISNDNLRNLDGSLPYTQDNEMGALTNLTVLNVDGGTITEANSVYARLFVNGTQVGSTLSNNKHPSWDITLASNSDNTIRYEVYDEAYKSDPVKYASHLITTEYVVTVDQVAPRIILADLGAAVVGQPWAIRIRAKDE